MSRRQECRPAVCAVVYVPTAFCCYFSLFPPIALFLLSPPAAVRIMLYVQLVPTNFQQPRTPLALAQT
eukprot:1119803-Heterocapsa_arctica.AAC.1